jgi:hypothetical protein
LPALRARGERARGASAVDELLSVQEADRAGKAAARQKSGKKAGKKAAGAAPASKATRGRKTAARTRR